MAETKVTVRSGQTLSSIAKANGTTVSAILKANPALTTNPKYNNGNTLFAGTKIIIPGSGSTPMTNNFPGTSDWRRGEEASMAGLTPSPTASPNPFTDNLSMSTDSPTAVPLTADKLSMAMLQKAFGITAAVINNDPSLLAALNRILGVDGGPMITDPALQEAIVKGTSWYRDQTDTQRQFDFAKATNPGQFAADLQKNASNIVKFQRNFDAPKPYC